jgi:hypothetical protein
LVDASYPFFKLFSQTVKLYYHSTLFLNSTVYSSAQIDKEPAVQTERPIIRERNTCLLTLRLSSGWPCATRTDQARGQGRGWRWERSHIQVVE